MSWRHGHLGTGRDPDGGGETDNLSDKVVVGDPNNLVLALVVTSMLVVLVRKGGAGQ